MGDIQLARGMGDTLCVCGAAGLVLLALLWLIDGCLFAFGIGVAVGLLVAYEIVRCWISCLL